MRAHMFTRLLAKSILHRGGRAALTTAAVLLGASLVAALLSVSLDVGSKAGAQLRAYGANLLLLPRGASLAAGPEVYLQEADLAFLEAQEQAGNLQYAPYLYAIVEAAGQKVVLAGTRFQAAASISPWWQIGGAWPDPANPASALVGATVGDRLGLRPGDIMTVRYGDASRVLVVAGLLETGGSEDSQILAHLPTVQGLVGAPAAIGLVQVSVSGGSPLEATARLLEAQVPGAEARIVGQIAQAEGLVLGKVQLLMLLVAALVVLASALALSSTLATAILERSGEIGLMKALGAGDGAILLLLATEVLFLGLLGGALGYGVGLALAQVVGYSVFGSSISPRPLALFITMAVALAVCLLCSIIPARRALAMDPAIILKGE